MTYFQPIVAEEALRTALSGNRSLYTLLIEPLREGLYQYGSFAFLDELPMLLQLLLSHDYVRDQVLQGGFIQLFHNGYVGLLPPLPEWWLSLQQPMMARAIDDALRLYVSHHVSIIAEMTPQAFALLYQRFPEFETVDQAFMAAITEAEKAMMLQIANQVADLVSVVDDESGLSFGS